MRKKAAEKGIELEVRSAGVTALDGAEATEAAVRVMEEKGIDHRSHRSRAVSRDLVEWADLILTMTSDHRKMMAQSYPEAADKLYTLKEYVLPDADREKLEELQRLQVELETVRAMLENEREQGNRSRVESLQKQMEEIEKKYRSLWREVSGILARTDVPDPFGGSEENYRQCRDVLDAELEKLLNRLQNSSTEER